MTEESRSEPLYLLTKKLEELIGHDALVLKQDFGGFDESSLIIGMTWREKAVQGFTRHKTLKDVLKFIKEPHD